MKNISLLLSLLVFTCAPANAAIIAPDASSDIPGDVLFNFQVSQSDEGALMTGFMSQSNPAISITSVVVSGTTNSGVAWLDGPSGGPAGLGVCQDDDCNGSSDDNVTVGESVLLTVSTAAKVGDIYFRNGSHGTTFASDAQVEITIDGMVFAQSLQAKISDFADKLFTSIKFAFVGDNNSNKHQFYVSGFGASVPLPAALSMMLMGLLGLFGFRKITA